MLALLYKPINAKRVLHRLYSVQAPIASSTIRDRFIQYFVNDNDHTHIRSCPLKPISDKTIPFVNAGMVQFKPVLLGQTLPPASKVANSQKCARVGGKHNDLEIVGTDGYHHTFFEMLGNWSFGNCNKFEACQLAWQLLTGSFGFGLNPSRLYVTYFGGDISMSLKPDLETKEIWRQLGVEENHIIPFGVKENFWEMGLVGPCGPCTEIHIDHIPNRRDSGARVNAGFSDLTELWNIVFIQYNRNSDGNLNQLSQSHIDTGMGFERLVAVMNGTQSTYDTDLFKPMMNVINKITGCPPYSSSFEKTDESYERDTAYRTLCDHSRLIAVALADNIVPHQESKLRRVLRRALNVSQNYFKKDQMLLLELTNYVADSLQSSFPEIGRNLSKVRRMILHEAEIYKSLTQEVPPAWLKVIKEKPDIESILELGSNRGAIAAAYRKLSTTNLPEITPALAYKFYDSHGMSSEVIAEFAKLCGKKFNVDAYKTKLENMKLRSKMATASGMTQNNLTEILSSAKITPTNDSFKYDFDIVNDTYRFPSVSAKVVGILVDGKLKHEAKGGTECGLILDRTNFYHSAGGQICDEGDIHFSTKLNLKGRSLSVKEVTKIGEHVVHFGNLNGSCRLGEEVSTEINEVNRINSMRNHTLAHLINGEMHRLFDAPLQEKCEVQPSFSKMTYNLCGEEFTAKDAKKLEDAILDVIQDELTVKRNTVNMWQVPPYTTLVPDQTYPVDNIHIIDIKRENKIISREACCGTHVLNTRDIGKFCIVGVIKSKKTSVCVVSGSEANQAIANSHELADLVTKFVEDVTELEAEIKKLEERMASLTTVPPLKSYIDKINRVQKRYVRIRSYVDENRTSYMTYDASAAALEAGTSKIQNIARYLSRLDVKRKSQGASYVVTQLQLSDLLTKVPLNKYTGLVDVPVMLLALHRTELKVRCDVPKGYITEEFNAVTWMREALDQLVGSNNDAVVIGLQIERQSAAIRSCIVQFKKGMLLRTKQERCLKATEACDKFARQYVKIQNVLKA